MEQKNNRGLAARKEKSKMRSVLNLIDEFLIASIEVKGWGGKIGDGRTYFFLTSF